MTEREMSEQAKHFSHCNTLKLCNLQEKDNVKCSFCTLKILGLAYCCECCDDFYLHQVCFHIPQYIKHKAHPKHPVSLVPTDNASSFTCQACTGESQLKFNFHYNCSCCKFNLHVICASMPKSFQHKNMYPLSLLYSFLSRDQEVNKSSTQPSNINLNVSADGSSTPPYQLKYFETACNGSFTCDICHNTVTTDCWFYHSPNFDYLCHFACAIKENLEKQLDQEFTVGVQCRLQKLAVHVDNFDPKKQEVKHTPQQQPNHFSHHHCLEKCEIEEDGIQCGICGWQVGGSDPRTRRFKASTAYGCNDCHYFLHERCFCLPHKILHHSHPFHPLILGPNLNHSDCRGCGLIGYIFVYKCSSCPDFQIDLLCAASPKIVSLKKGKFNLVCHKPIGQTAFSEDSCVYCGRDYGSMVQWAYYNSVTRCFYHVRCARFMADVFEKKDYQSGDVDRILSLQVE